MEISEDVNMPTAATIIIGINPADQTYACIRIHTLAAISSIGMIHSLPNSCSESDSPIQSLLILLLLYMQFSHRIFFHIVSPCVFIPIVTKTLTPCFPLCDSNWVATPDHIYYVSVDYICSKKIGHMKLRRNIF